jgi:ABC-type multidrug transport system fused ATPase/permease subunit
MKHHHIDPIGEPQRIVNYWKKEKGIVACIVFFGLTFNISAILAPIYQGKLIDAIAGNTDTASLLELGATFVAIVVSIQLLRYCKRFFIRRFANDTGASMRLMVYHNIIGRNMGELDTTDVGNLMTRAIGDVALCVEGMRKFTTEIFDTGVLMTAYVVTLFVYDRTVTLLSCISIPVAMIIAERLKSLIYRYTQSYREKSGEIAQRTLDATQNLMMYRVAGVESENGRRYETALEELRTRATKASILENAGRPAYAIIAMAGVVFVLFLGGERTIAGRWSVGMFVTYMTIYSNLAVKASKAAKLFNSVQKSQVSWKRIRPFLSEYGQEPPARLPIAGKTTLATERLGFSYPGKPPVLEDVTFSAESGQIVGITGPVASGKSTLGIALLGLHPYQGSIRIGGRELRDYTKGERSLMVSYLGHESQLLSTTIRENITMGRDLEINEVLEDVCFTEDLRSMKEGVETMVGSGGDRLSGGQQARIALARALVDHRHLIILDDPFSALDRKTERQILGNLKKHYGTSIILIISHRLAIFDSVDKIVLVDGCTPARCRTHRQLLAESPFYASVYALQKGEAER